MGYKYIQLSLSEVKILEDLVKNHLKHHVRVRCQSILLSNQGYDIKSIAKIYGVRVHTVGVWFSRWRLSGVAGLDIVKGRGRKAELLGVSAQVIEDIKSSVASNPQDLSGVCGEINEKWGLSLSKNQVQMYLKKS